MTTTRKTYTTCDGAIEFAECEHGTPTADFDPTAAACSACDEPTEAELSREHNCKSCNAEAHLGKVCCKNCIHYSRRWRNQDGTYI